MDDPLLLELFTGTAVRPQSTAGASASDQAQASVLDSAPNEGSSWAQPFAQWDSIMSSSAAEIPAVRRSLSLRQGARFQTATAPAARLWPMLEGAHTV